MQNDNYLKTFDWLLNDDYRVIWHIIFWVVVYLDEILSFVGITPELDIGYFFLFVAIISILYVYVNLYYLVPELLFKDRANEFFIYGTLLFILFLTCEFAITYPILISLYGEEAIGSPLMLVLSSTTYYGGILGIALAINIFKRFLRNQEKIKELENTNLETELAYLKEQINPHFLFNSLNNIYVQSRKRPDEVPESILTLSELLRYQLYDCSHGKVKLKDEIIYLQNYLAIDKLRKTNEAFDIQTKGEVNGVMVAPFLFIPFIENAVKHGVDLNGESYIKVFFEVHNDHLLFTVENSKPKQQLEHRSGGIGLTNVKRRLALLYPDDKHKLDIQEGEDSFKVYLDLNLNE